MSLYRLLLSLLNKTLKFNPAFEKFLQTYFELAESNKEDTVRRYTSSNLQMQLIRDHNNLQFIIIASSKNSEDGFDIDIIRSYILSKTRYLEPLVFEENCKFIIDNYNTIKIIFNENYASSKREMEEIEKKRANKLFQTTE